MQKRIRYIDILRGITMLLVVFQHIRYFSCGLKDAESDPLAYFVISFFLPMFFFISGYVSYKATTAIWSFTTFRSKLLKKAQVLLIPTVFFWSLIRILGLRDWTFPGGFWFTEVLFEMLLIYFTFSYIDTNMNVKKTDRGVCGVEVCMMLLSVVLFTVKSKFLDLDSPVISCLCMTELGGYLIYFSFGLICKKYKDRFFHLCDNPISITLILALSIVILIAQYKIEPLRHFGPLVVVKGLLLVMLIFTCFRSNETYWEKKSLCSNSLEYIGRRTLDLYLLHYFFLPYLPGFDKIFNFHQNPTLEFFTVGILTLCVTGCCLIVSKLLRTSPIVARYLFGVENTM